MQKIRNNNEYVKFLEDYMFISESNRPFTGSSYKLPFLADSIKDYKGRKRITSPRLKLLTIIFTSVISSMMMGITIIWCSNELVKFEIAYSLRNIAAIAFVFLIGKTKVAFFREM